MELREYQETFVNNIARKLASGVKNVVGQLATGGGKCLGWGTPILMYDGTIKAVQEVQVGDKLMGPNSKPRLVRSVCSGREEMYMVKPVKGEPYIVNKSHILSLKISGYKSVTAGNGVVCLGGSVCNISVADYLQSSKTFKHVAKTWRTGVDFADTSKTLLMNPYILGVWLGDGTTKKPSITTPDPEIVRALKWYASEIGCNLREELVKDKCAVYHFVGANGSNGCKGGSNPFLNLLSSLNLLDNKHIPHQYLTANREDRMALLAGIVDTDGTAARTGIDLVFKSHQLANDTVFLARSLGFAAYISPCEKTCTNNGVTGVYFRISISGNCSDLPLAVLRKLPAVRRQIKDHLVSGITVKSIGEGDYYGFEIDGDRLFMLGDFTVTHNTIVFSAICQRFTAKWPGKSVLILVHRKELLQQTRRTLYKAFSISAQPIIAGMRHIPAAPVYVGMIESAYRRRDRIHNIGLVIIDEAHIASFSKIHEHYPDTMIIGFTATPLSANKKEPMKKYYQDIVCGIDIPQLIGMGSLCQNLTIAPRDTVERASLTIKRGDFDEGMMAMQFSQKKHIDNTVNAYARYANGTKAIVFNITIEHSKKVTEAFVSAGYPCRHLDGETIASARTETLKWFSETPNAVLCNVGVATTGFDEPTIETVIVNKATTSMPLWLQMTGRGSRPTEAKIMFRIIDLGGNAVVHGDWNQPRDWENIFWNPPKAGEGGGVAPVKVCPECESIIPAQCKTCPQCGFVYQEKEEPAEETPLGEFVTVTQNINVHELIQQHQEKKEYYPFFNIGRQLAENARTVMASIDDHSVQFILDQYYKLGEEWCNEKGKKWNAWHKGRAQETLYEELAKRFKKWKNPLQTETPAPIKAKAPTPLPVIHKSAPVERVKRFDMLPSLFPIENISNL